MLGCFQYQGTVFYYISVNVGRSNGTLVDRDRYHRMHYVRLRCYRYIILSLLVIACMAWYRWRRDNNTGVSIGTCLCLSSVSIIENVQHLITLVGMYCQVFWILNRYFRKKTKYIDYISYTRSHSHMMDMTSNRHSGHPFLFCAFGAVVVQTKTCISFCGLVIH